MTDTENGGSEQAIQQALEHVRTADEWRKRREMDQLKKELNLAKAILSRALHTESDDD